MSSPNLSDIIMSSFAGAITDSHRLFRGVLPRTLIRASKMSTPVISYPPLLLRALCLILGFFKAEPEIRAYTEWWNQKCELKEQRQRMARAEKSITARMKHWVVCGVTGSSTHRTLWHVPGSQEHLSINSWPPLIKDSLLGTLISPRFCVVHMWSLSMCPWASHSHDHRSCRAEDRGYTVQSEAKDVKWHLNGSDQTLLRVSCARGETENVWRAPKNIWEINAEKRRVKIKLFHYLVSILNRWF